MRWLCVLLVVAACGSRGSTRGGSTAPSAPQTLDQRMLAMLPPGVQVLVEIDLARLRSNKVVGPFATKALGDLGADAKLPGLPVEVQGSPLAAADVVMLASYGVGTAQAATVIILATKAELENAVRLAPDIVALGPEDWLRQLEARAAIAARERLEPSIEVMKLREHAMPDKAPGAVLRVTARLSFDARVALARQVGVDAPPAQVSIWADIVDDAVIIIDADAADPGDKKNKDAAKRLSATITALLQGAARDPVIRLLGLPSALTGAKMIVKGTWVRAIIEVPPRRLARVVERAGGLL